MSESSSQDDEQLEKLNARMERRRSRDSVCAPEFQQELSSRDVSVGDTVYFTVKSTGIPEPEVTWYRNGELLKEDSRIKFIKDSQTGNYSLLINKVAVEDEGEYRCVASNMGGSVACQAKLLVKGKEKSIPLYARTSYQEYVPRVPGFLRCLAGKQFLRCVRFSRH